MIKLNILWRAHIGWMVSQIRQNLMNVGWESIHICHNYSSLNDSISTEVHWYLEPGNSLQVFTNLIIYRYENLKQNHSLLYTNLQVSICAR